MTPEQEKLIEGLKDIAQEVQLFPDERPCAEWANTASAAIAELERLIGENEKLEPVRYKHTEKPLLDYPDFDDEGYPTELTIETIQRWPINSNPKSLIDFVCEAWNYGENAYSFEDNYYGIDEPVIRMSTLGWSGNEDLISAMQENFVFWTLNFVGMTRGGHYAFKYPLPSGGDAE